MEPNKNSKNSVNTKLDATLRLREMSNRMLDLTKELNAYYGVLIDDKTKNYIKKQVLNSIKNNLIPYLERCSVNIKESANLLAPIAGSSYVSKILDRKRKRSQEENKEKSNSYKLRTILTLFARQALPSIQPKRKTTFPTTPHLLIPSNSPFNTKQEFYNIQSKIINPKLKSLFINEAVAKKVMPIGRSSLYAMIKSCDEKDISLNLPWKKLDVLNY